jgi:hypothetical protein
MGGGWPHRLATTQIHDLHSAVAAGCDGYRTALQLRHGGREDRLAGPMRPDRKAAVQVHHPYRAVVGAGDRHRNALHLRHADCEHRSGRFDERLDGLAAVTARLPHPDRAVLVGGDDHQAAVEHGGGQRRDRRAPVDEHRWRAGWLGWRGGPGGRLRRLRLGPFRPAQWREAHDRLGDARVAPGCERDQRVCQGCERAGGEVVEGHVLGQERDQAEPGLGGHALVQGERLGRDRFGLQCGPGDLHYRSVRRAQQLVEDIRPGVTRLERPVANRLEARLLERRSQLGQRAAAVARAVAEVDPWPGRRVVRCHRALPRLEAVGVHRPRGSESTQIDRNGQVPRWGQASQVGVSCRRRRGPRRAGRR